MSAVLAGGALSKLRCSYHECFCIFTHIPKKLLMVGSQYNTVQWKTNMHNVGVKYQRKRSCPLTRYALSLRCTLRHQWYNGTYMFVFDTTACFCVCPRCAVRWGTTWKHGDSYSTGRAPFHTGGTAVVYLRTLPRMCDKRRTLAPDSSAFRSKSSRSNVQLRRAGE